MSDALDFSQGLTLYLFESPALAGLFFTTGATWEAQVKGGSVSRSVVSDSLRPHGLKPPDSSVHGILQARILEWVAIPSSRGSS